MNCNNLIKPSSLKLINRFVLTQASTKSEKESVNTSIEALKQLSERMNELVGKKAVNISAFVSVSFDFRWLLDDVLYLLNLHLPFKRVFWLIYDLAVSEALSANAKGLVKMVWKIWIYGYSKTYPSLVSIIPKTVKDKTAAKKRSFISKIVSLDVETTFPHTIPSSNLHLLF